MTDNSVVTRSSKVTQSTKVTQHSQKKWYWPKRYNLLALCFFAAFVCYIDRVNISVAVIAMQKTFAWSETTKGLVLSSFFIGYMLFQIPSGYLANRFGGKVVLGVAVAWWSLFTLITPWAAAASFPLLIAVRIGMGLGEAAMFPGAYSLFGRWIPPAESSRAVSLLLSGVPIGTVFALITTGWIIAHYGWPPVFYLFGAVGIFWVIIWFAKAYNSPEQHPRLSEAERALLAENQTTQSPENISATTPVTTPVTTPWKKIFRTPALWALIINHFCSNWSLYMLLAWLPSYFKALGLSIEYAGLFSAAPWLIMFLTINLAGWIADGMIRRGTTLTTVRKLMQTIGLGGSATFLLLASGIDSTIASVILMCGSLGTLGFTWSGFGPNHLDIAPRHAGVLMGITNTAGTVPGIIGVAITGWLVDVTGAYSSAFVLAAGVNLLGIVVWLIWGTAKRIID